MLQKVMHTLKSKDSHHRRAGEAKACWFVESVEEVAQPLRFEASEVAKKVATATTVDFVTMYPSFDQELLKERLRDSISEAWEWEAQKPKEGKHLRLKKGRWVWLTDEDLSKPTIGTWTQKEVLDLVEFVINNWYVKCGNVILRQVKGFGMGLACAPQIANQG